MRASDIYLSVDKMPKGTKSVGVLCGELGLDGIADSNFRKESQAYLKANIADVPNATDDAIEKLAMEWLDGGAGENHFSVMAGTVS